MARTSRKNGKSIVQKRVPEMKIALYVRLSNEDNGGKSADSINNQIGLLLDVVNQLKEGETFCEDTSVLCGGKGEIIGTYIDNGQTGTDFARPEWERMMEDVKKRRINCIIVKDLSRFARNYLDAGDYLEKIFPFLGVRFIAVNDHFDSAGKLFQDKELVTEFKNLANDYYSKDISKKIMSAFRIKKEQGQFIGSKAPYGYILENNRYVIDEAAADVVRRIFTMKLQGTSSYKIADILNREGIPSPSRYAGEHEMKKYKNCGNVLWQMGSVNRILYNKAYVGDLVQGKYNQSIYSKEKRGKREEAAWEVWEDVHPAIIDRELFLKVQEIRKKNQKVWQDRQGGPGYGNVLKDILVCGICGHAMRRNKDVRNGKARYYFYCGFAYGHSKVKCSTSSIVDYKIFDMILEQIKLQIDLAVEANRFIEQMKNSDCRFAVYREKKNELERAKDELSRYIYLKASIYEDMKQGILTKEEFLTIKEKYALKISEMEAELDKKEKDLADFEQRISDTNPWLKTFLNFRDAKVLTRKMAERLLEKVEIYEDKRVHIKFRFRNEYPL